MKHKILISLGVVAAAAVALCSWIGGQNTDQPAPQPDPDYILSDDEDERKNQRIARQKKQDRVSALGSALLLPVTALVNLAGFFLRRVLAPVMNPVLHFAGEAALNGVLLTGVTAALWKAVFPDRSLREFFRWKNLRWILLVSLLLPAVHLLLGRTLENYEVVSVAIRTVLLSAAVVFLWLKIFGSALGTGGRLRELAHAKFFWLLPLFLLAAVALYGWGALDVSHETIGYALLGALWFYLTAVGTAGVILLHRREKLRKLEKQNSAAPAA